MQTQLNLTNKTRTKLLLVNLAIDLAKHCARNLDKSELASTKKSHTTQELERFAASVTNAQLKKLGVPIRYKEMLNKLGQLIEGRNIVAHESSPELARLLILPASQQTYLRFQELYPVLYGESIEERAEGGDILDDLL